MLARNRFYFSSSSSSFGFPFSFHFIFHALVFDSLQTTKSLLSENNEICVLFCCRFKYVSRQRETFNPFPDRSVSVKIKAPFKRDKPKIQFKQNKTNFTTSLMTSWKLKTFSMFLTNFRIILQLVSVEINKNEKHEIIRENRQH